jgi:F-type H+-transporting ATPase subunit a
MSGLSPLAIEIHPGEHPEWHPFGLTINADTVWCTVIAGAIVVIAGLILRSQITKRNEDYVPTKLQILWETVVGQVETQVEDNLGTPNKFVVPLAVALFFFILICNWMEMIPSELNHRAHLLPSPTADTNLTYAMSAFVIVGVWIYGIRTQGAKAYFSHFLQPFPFLLPLNIIEEITKPISLALRLFGNIFAGGILLALIGALTTWTLGPAPIGGVLSIFFAIIWKLFDMAIGAIQAFIFALLTVLYFGMAAGHGGHDEEEPTNADDTTADATREAEPELAA